MKIACAQMMTRTFAALAVAALALPSAFAEDKNTPTGVVPTSDLIGKDVKNGAGESLGDIEEVVVDIKSGDVVYLVVSYGETLGLGGKWFAVAPKAFTFAQNRDHLILDVPKATFDQNKGFTDDAWPNEPDHSLVKSGGEQPKAKADRMTMRYSKLKDLDIIGRDEKKLGEIDGMALDVQNNKIAYAALGYGGVADVGEKWFAVAWEDLQYSPQNKNFRLNAVAADFDNREGFGEQWPAKPDRRFKAEEK